MPTLPSAQGFVPHIIPANAPTTAPAEYAAQRAGSVALAGGDVGNPATALSGSVQAANDILSNDQIQSQRRYDAIVGTQARTGYRAEADKLQQQLMEKGAEDPDSFQGHVSALEDLKQKTLDNFKGSKDARAVLEADLGEMGLHYGQQAYAIHHGAVIQALDAETAATANNLADQVRRNPAGWNRARQAADAYVDSISGALTPQQAADRKTALHAEITISAARSLIMQGRTDAARAILDAAPPEELTPHQKEPLYDAIARAEIPPAPAKLPEGYRSTAKGDLEAIPGGPADPAVIEREVAAKRGPQELYGGLTGDQQKIVSHTLDEFRQEHTVQQYRAVQPQADTALNAPDSLAGDQMIVTAAAKLSDPTTGVREGEAAAWAPNTVQSMLARVESVFTGQSRLPPQVRTDLLTMIDNLRRGIRENYDNTVSDYRDRLGNFGIPDPDKFLNPRPYTGTTATKPGKSGGSLKARWDKY